MTQIKHYELGELADVTKLAGFEFTKYIKYNNYGEIIALRALNLRHGELDLTDIKRIDRSVSELLPRSKLYINDILLTYTGNGYGDCAIIEENDKYHLAPNICKIASNVEKVVPYYLYSYIRTNEFYKIMSSHMTGSSQPTIPMKTIRMLPIPLPPIVVQEKIAEVAYCINEKIRKNNAINKNLLEQAQAIYTKMFITDADSLWPEGKLSDLIEVCYGKDHKKLHDGDIPVYGSGGIMRHVDRALYEQESVLVPRKGTLNNVMYVNEPFWSVDTMFFTKMKRQNVAKFVFHFLKGKDLASMNAGSAVPSMTTKILNAIPLQIPDDQMLSTFEAQVSPFYQTASYNNKESENLAAIRDSLLPKLMSGEIDVSDIDL